MFRVLGSGIAWVLLVMLFLLAIGVLEEVADVLVAVLTAP